MADETIQWPDGTPPEFIHTVTAIADSPELALTDEQRDRYFELAVECVASVLAREDSR
ncbi:hypothetical protein I6A60_00555 [Frankia sp. AgB1.9]|uniref:hypothetical protein n=1 Tax=unclassified Frankia TaxID=2632575 RepID=UPI0019312F8F|nr:MULTISPECIES: hypothetical protein [unclassified Frankia]MBL7487371.1 hypothetical protein [Frankia sp. AgW1.1]MBL7546379.1 hypothetical protein [Frankia sp. AgB1.9]MBL7618576.1 hypothetical protein [Frankia sp. AgB1.8]